VLANIVVCTQRKCLQIFDTDYCLVVEEPKPLALLRTSESRWQRQPAAAVTESEPHPRDSDDAIETIPIVAIPRPSLPLQASGSHQQRLIPEPVTPVAVVQTEPHPFVAAIETTSMVAILKSQVMTGKLIHSYFNAGPVGGQGNLC
jgi:hypothetical protein